MLLSAHLFPRLGVMGVAFWHGLAKRCFQLICSQHGVLWERWMHGFPLLKISFPCACAEVINFNSEQLILSHLCKPPKSLCQHQGGSKQLGVEEAAFGTSASSYLCEVVTKFWVRFGDQSMLIRGFQLRSALWCPFPTPQDCTRGCIFVLQRVLGEEKRLSDCVVLWPCLT